MVASTIFCTQCGAANPSQAKFCFSCGQTVREQHKTGTDSQSGGLLKPGKVLKQRYRVLSQIGQGGFGAVYKAEDKELGKRLLAVKEMSQQNLSPEEIREGMAAFKREALMLAGLRHEHLPRIYDHFSEHSRWYLVMDYIEGETLEAHLDKSRDGTLPLVMALKIAGQLCTVLDYLHTRQPPIIFRDLKPSNVILTPEGNLYLIDFGIARHFKPGQTRDTIAFGSPGYAAPEQYGKAQTTPRADIYSLGTILHQMLSGTDPSLAPFRFAPLTSQQPDLQQLVVSMVAMDEEKRPASIVAVRQILQQVKDQPGTAALVPQQAVSAGAGLPAIIRQSPKTMATMSPIAPAVIHEHHYGLVRALAWSPDGTYVASATDAIIRVWEAQNSKNVASYREHTGPIRHMAWSPSTMQIASISDEPRIHIWDGRHGKTLSVHANEAGSSLSFRPKAANVLAWSHDGHYLAVAGDGYIQVWNIRHNKIEARLTRKIKACKSISWSPDGTKIAASYDNRILIWQPDTNKNAIIKTYYYPAQVNVVAWSPDGTYLASGDQNKLVCIWNVHSEQTVGVYRNHLKPISALAWSPNSRYIVSGSLDPHVHIWDAMTGWKMNSYSVSAGVILAVACSPDGHSILAGGSDRRVYAWPVL